MDPVKIAIGEILRCSNHVCLTLELLTVVEGKDRVLLFICHDASFFELSTNLKVAFSIKESARGDHENHMQGPGLFIFPSDRHLDIRAFQSFRPLAFDISRRLTSDNF